MIIARNSSWQNYYTNIIHVGSYSSSRVYVKGIALDSSTIIHRGLAKVLNGALEASSTIESEILVFGEKAKANSVPMLKIETYNVKEARHVTSISRLSGDHIFYLASRGIDVKEAEKLIIKGVSERSLEKIEVPTKEFLGKLIYEKLTIENR